MIYMGGKTSAASKNKWIANTYDRINLTVPKGQKEVIQIAAQAANESVNAYIYAAIMQRMEREQSTEAGADFQIAPERSEDLSE